MASTTDFWETAFTDKGEMWGRKPARTAEWTKDLFLEKSVKNILIPGIGYGRNALPFIENGITVTGIEISKSAIDLAKKQYGSKITMYHGSVADMPFDNEKYDGIFCHALIHLLDREARKKLIRDCYNQLAGNGWMVFTAITKEAPQYGKGDWVGKDRYELHPGAKIFYYDLTSVTDEFEPYGLMDASEVDENQPMFRISCKKGPNAAGPF